MAERTTKTVNRGFESDSRDDSFRRRESAGCWAAAAARRDEASGAIVAVGASLVADEPPDPAPARTAAFRLSACRLRWGSKVLVSVTSDVDAVGATLVPLNRAKRLFDAK